MNERLNEDILSDWSDEALERYLFFVQSQLGKYSIAQNQLIQEKLKRGKSGE